MAVVVVSTTEGDASRRRRCLQNRMRVMTSVEPRTCCGSGCNTQCSTSTTKSVIISAFFGEIAIYRRKTRCGATSSLPFEPLRSSLITCFKRRKTLGRLRHSTKSFPIVNKRPCGRRERGESSPVPMFAMSYEHCSAHVYDLIIPLAI